MLSPKTMNRMRSAAKAYASHRDTTEELDGPYISYPLGWFKDTSVAEELPAASTIEAVELNAETADASSSTAVVMPKLAHLGLQKASKAELAAIVAAVLEAEVARYAASSGTSNMT